jgi:hypothetical protein
MALRSILPKNRDEIPPKNCAALPTVVDVTRALASEKVVLEARELDRLGQPAGICSAGYYSRDLNGKIFGPMRTITQVFAPGTST